MEKTEQKFNTKITENLQADETVLWDSRPEAFPLKNEANKKSLLMRWVICAALFAVLTAAYTIYSLRIPAGFKPVVVIILALVFGYLMLTPVLDRNKVQKKCRYLVTDKRAIVAVGDNGFHAVSRAGLKVDAIPAENGCVHLLLGAAADTPEKKYLTRTFVPVKAEGTEDVTGIVFYNVKDTAELRAFFNY